jgi:hypothetical protein
MVAATITSYRMILWHTQMQLYISYFFIVENEITHPHLAPKLKKEYYTPLLGLRVLL